jgi:hypothetical protein
MFRRNILPPSSGLNLSVLDPVVICYASDFGQNRRERETIEAKGKETRKEKYKQTKKEK